MSENVIVSGPNFFQRTLVPADSSLVRGAMREAAKHGTSDNILVRHVVSTAFAVASVALSILNTISYLLQIPVKIVLNIVRFDPKGLVFDFAQSLSDTARSLLMGAFGATYVIGGILFPEEVYGFFKPAVIKTAEDALGKKQKELETALEDNKSLQENADQFLKKAKEIEAELNQAKQKLHSAATPEEVQTLRKDLAEIRQKLDLASDQSLELRDELGAEKRLELEKLVQEHQQAFQNLSDKLGNEKKAELKKLGEQHQKSVEKFEEKLQQKTIGSATDKQLLENLQEKHKLEVGKLNKEHEHAIGFVQKQVQQEKKAELKKLMQEHQKSVEEFEEKLQQKTIGSATDKQLLENFQKQHILELGKLNEKHEQATSLVQKQVQQLDNEKKDEFEKLGEQHQKSVEELKKQLQQKTIGSATDKQLLEKQHTLEVGKLIEEHKIAIGLVQTLFDEQVSELGEKRTAHLELQEETDLLRKNYNSLLEGIYTTKEETQQTAKYLKLEIEKYGQLECKEPPKPDDNGLRKELELSQLQVQQLKGRVEELERAPVNNSAALLSTTRPSLLLSEPLVNEELASSLTRSLHELVDPIARAEVVVVPKNRPESQTIIVNNDSFVELQRDERSDVEQMRSQIGFTGQANLMTFLYHFFDDESEAPVDTQPISFNLETGRIELKADDKARANFCQILRETYGGNAATRAISLYSLEKAGPLTYLDVKKAIVAVAAHVKVKDLAALFDDLKKTSASRLITLLIPEGERKEILQFDSFDTIPPHHEALHLLLNAYRTLPKPGAETMERVPVFNYFAIGSAPSQKFSGFQQYYHDLKTLFDAALPAIVESSGVKTELPSSIDLRKMCISEHFAKSWGYREIRPGNIATQFGRTLFQLVSEIEHKGDAVFFRFYAPMNSQAGKYDEEHPLALHLVTRGTQWKLSSQDSGVSLARDIELTGVGKRSFALRAEEMKKIITEYLESVPEGVPVHLSLDGHSLGGCDEMRVATLVAKLLAERPDLAKKVTKVHVNPQNPPALDPATNKEFAMALKTLEQQHPGKEELFDLTYSLFDNDSVQRIAFGVYLGAGIDSPLLKCRAILLKPPTDYKGAIHGARPFTNDADRVFEAAVVDEKVKLAPILERENYRDPENGVLTNVLQAVTGTISSLTLNSGHALVNPFVRFGVGVGGIVTGRSPNDNLYDSRIKF